MALTRPCILVGDAQPGFVRALRIALTNRGCQVHVASDGLEAVAHLRRKAPALAIVDAALPLMDGFQVAALARSISPGMPCVITSTSDDPQLRQQASHVGVYAFVVKPVDASRLAWLVDQAVAKMRVRAGSARSPVRASARSPSGTLRRLQRGHALIIEFSRAKSASDESARLALACPFNSRLVACSPKWIAVEAPGTDGVQGCAALGAAVSVAFGLSDGWYRFTTRVLGTQREKGGVLLLAPPAAVACRERRRRPRKAIEALARSAPAGKPAGSRPGRVVNVSAGGVCFTSPSPLAEGSAVALWLRPGPGKEPQELRGVVAWAKRRARCWMVGASIAARGQSARSLLAALSRKGA
jgi:CheY-like chemotaxis protein